MQKRRVIGTIPINVTTEFEKAPLPDLCRTILANKSGGGVGVVMEEVKCEQVGMLIGDKWEKMHDIGRRVYSPKGLAPTQHTCGGGNLETKIVVAVDEQNKALRTDGTVGTLTTDGSSPKHNNSVLEGTLKAQMCEQLIQSGAVQENDVIRHSYTRSRMKGEMRDIQQNNMSPTIDTRADCLGVVRNFRIRKLTPTECGRLMGVKDSDIALVTQNLSNSGQYHIFGDSIVTTVLMQIFGKMFNIDYKKKTQEAIEEICQHHTS